MITTIILAAGKGTRMNSTLPKVATKFKGIPMLCWVIKIAQDIESEKICVVVGYKKKIVQSLVKSKVTFVEQTKQKGTGDAVMATEKELKNFSGDVLVLCGDTPNLKAKTIQNLLNFHKDKNNICTVLTARLDNPSSYGRIIRTQNDNLEKIVEFKDASSAQKKIKEINSGIYIFKSKYLFDALKKLNCKNAQGEFYLTDTVEIIKKRRLPVGAFVCQDSLEIMGVNSMEDLQNLEKLSSRV